MTPVLRGLLWAAVILAPGGVVLLPFAVKSMRGKPEKATPDPSPAVPSV